MFPLHPTQDDDWIRLKTNFETDRFILIDQICEVEGATRFEMTTQVSLFNYKIRLREALNRQCTYWAGGGDMFGSCVWDLTQHEPIYETIDGKKVLMEIRVKRSTISYNRNMNNFTTDDLFRTIKSELDDELANNYAPSMLPLWNNWEVRNSTYRRNGDVSDIDALLVSFEKEGAQPAYDGDTISIMYPGINTANGDALTTVASELGSVTRRFGEGDDSLRRRLLAAIRS